MRMLSSIFFYIKSKFSVIFGNAASGALSYFWVGKVCILSGSALYSVSLTLVPMSFMIISSSIAAIQLRPSLHADIINKFGIASRITIFTTSFLVVVIILIKILSVNISLPLIIACVVNMIIASMSNAFLYSQNAAYVDLGAKRNIYTAPTLIMLLSMPIFLIASLSSFEVIVISSIIYATNCNVISVISYKSLQSI
jgi:hypothetical protein